MEASSGHPSRNCWAKFCRSSLTKWLEGRLSTPVLGDEVLNAVANDYLHVWMMTQVIIEYVEQPNILYKEIMLKGQLHSPPTCIYPTTGKRRGFDLNNFL